MIGEIHTDLSGYKRIKIFDEGELICTSTVAKFATVQREGKSEVKRAIEYYNLDVAISVGYRVKSLRGKMTRRDILENVGKISHKLAIEKAHKEYEQYVEKESLKLSKVEKDFLVAIDNFDDMLKNKQNNCILLEGGICSSGI